MSSELGTSEAKGRRDSEASRQAVLALDKKSIVEMKALNNPPVGVKDIMTATVMLLGTPPKEAMEWKTVRSEMGTIGKGNIMEKVSQFDSKNLTPDVAKKAMKLIENYTTPQMMKISNAAAVFHQWASCVTEDVETEAK